MVLVDFFALAFVVFLSALLQFAILP